MLYRASADAVVIAHLLFILFVVLGGFLVLRNRRWIFLHLPAAAWGTFVELQGWVCPLTPLETWLRNKGSQSPYDTSFIEHYLIPVIYPPGLTHDVQILLGSAVILINMAIYYRVYRTMKRAREN